MERPTRVTLRLNPQNPQHGMQRRSAGSMGGPSGSEYSGGRSASSNGSRMDPDEDEIKNEEEEEEPAEEYSTTTKGRRIKKMSYVESGSDDIDDAQPIPLKPTRRKKPANPINSEESDGGEGDANGEGPRYKTRSRLKKKSHTPQPSSPSERQIEQRALRAQQRQEKKEKKKSARELHEEQGYDDGDADADGSPDLDEDEIVVTSPDPPSPLPPPRKRTPPPKAGPRGYALRKRGNINYAIPPALEDMIIPAAGRPKPKAKGKRGLGWNVSGAELTRALGMPLDDSDSDAPNRSPRKGMNGMANGTAAGAGGGMFASGPLPQDLAGTPSNLGKVSGATLADSDPLGVNPNVTFDSVGGLAAHIAQLKEMTLLPLLYPEVFQRFGLIPPRGVLFHGPPGTGKTLLARALASSCRSGGRSITFFMRKGADILSKWVGEAERQLRLLFEEARNSQPSIIFFDEIDGLAPVRSSKQDQIHASIVSTLLALMDGMDGRGQVIVIGATNRPDAIDPALRRPGRFDREFYFPLPSLSARERILEINTSSWEGWEAGNEKAVGMRKELAKLTKGYGGADLRALCTEAALNAVQRTYPQIYQSQDRLVVKPEKIEVRAKDFMLSIKKLVPASARSSAAAAAPLPSQLEPLLSNALERVKKAVEHILPISKKRDTLEDAEWEDVEGDSQRDFEREMFLQSLETQRVYRPRLVLCGPRSGTGVGYVGAAVLNWLEDFHVQSLDLGTLLGDSTRTAEAAIVQLFVEAKRHQPSVIYIPSLLGWCSAVTETARTTMRSMLDTLSPNDPILLLAIVDGPFSSLPRDVRKWFGMALRAESSNRVDFAAFAPSEDARTKFFADIVANVSKKPTDFPDAWKRKKRVLEKLEIAPPIQPKGPSEAELKALQEADLRTMSVLKYRLGPILSDLKRKFKIFCKKASDEYAFHPETGEPIEQAPNEIPLETQPTAEAIVLDPAPGVNGMAMAIDGSSELVTSAVPHGDGLVPPVAPQLPPEADPADPSRPRVKFFNMDLEKIHSELYKDRYLTPDDFLEDIQKIVKNARLAEVVFEPFDPDRKYRAEALLTAAQVHYHDFDPLFRAECERMAARERKRREDAQKALEKEQAKNQEKEDENVYAPGTRRSARNNGQEPEVPITDVGRLERQLKRQRGSNENSEESHAEEDAEGRSQKRQKTADGDIDPNERDELDLVGLNSSPLQPVVPVLPVDLTNGPSSSQMMSVSSMLNNVTPLSPFASVPQPAPNLLPGLVPQAQNAPIFPVLPRSPFAPALSGPAFTSDPSQSLLNPFNNPPPEAVTSAPSVVPETPPSIPSQTVPNSEPDVSMEVERPPTPLPDFHVDESLLSNLEKTLVSKTKELNVEQLEQLRAACLESIWEHRSEWDRDGLIRQLTSFVGDFVADAVLDDDDSSPEEFAV
ncbi:AAA-domain-containing protein [Sistotremastrum suecicum HHB10207 ss-3]|uniref:AAA-domain-containing protein n=1 Tax=Sistotremastrum suecicum HHB10207 ss-3 TaxID=1314776 RepID=A0A166ADQ2_9AGAM|nr:AAA-domain-containing protein [Sistotremastrum suecicum HHB10207 ss-3]